VTTARITHATPSPFYGHAVHRGQEDTLAVQLLEASPAVALGGGARHFRPVEAGGRRTDGADLEARARREGFALQRELETPLPVDRPVLGLYAESHLPHELDRDDEPDLAELAVAAVRRLRATGKPWFLLVEEGRIDSAAHDHDGPGLAQNVLRLDRALDAILREVSLDSTLVVLCSDHATASPTLLEWAHPDSLELVTMSVEAMERRIFGGEPWLGTPRALEEAALPVLDEGGRQTGLSSSDLDRLVTAEKHYDRRTAIGNAISRRLGISFLAYEDHLASSEVHGHTAELVPIRAWGRRASEIEEVRDHAALGRWLRVVMELEPSAPADSGTVTATTSGLD
jgi:alkaline phosphatase